MAGRQPRQRLGGQGVVQAFEDAGELGQHVLADVPTLGARIADQLVGLVEGLGLFQDLGGGEAEAAVGIALQVGQVIERRRPVVLHLLVHLAHGPALGMRRQFPLQALGLGPFCRCGSRRPGR